MPLVGSRKIPANDRLARFSVACSRVYGAQLDAFSCEEQTWPGLSSFGEQKPQFGEIQRPKCWPASIENQDRPCMSFCW